MKENINTAFSLIEISIEHLRNDEHVWETERRMLNTSKEKRIIKFEKNN